MTPAHLASIARQPEPKARPHFAIVLKAPIAPRPPTPAARTALRPGAVVRPPSSAASAAPRAVALREAADAHRTTAATLQRDRRQMLADGERLRDGRQESTGLDTQQVQERVAALVEAPSAALTPVAPPPPPAALAVAAPSLSGASTGTALAQAARLAQTQALIASIEVFVKSGRPALALALPATLGSRAELERAGKGAVALRLLGNGRPVRPDDVRRIREALSARGITVQRLTVA